MRGYWNQPRATAEALRGGWLRTGDVGRLDADGYLYIHDRLKDMIVSGGANVYPRMVEQVLEAHPAVAEVAVIGVPDAHWGESVKAVVVLHPDATASEHELIDFCRDKLGGFQRPRSVDFVDALPRTATREGAQGRPARALLGGAGAPGGRVVKLGARLCLCLRRDSPSPEGARPAPFRSCSPTGPCPADFGGQGRRPMPRFQRSAARWAYSPAEMRVLIRSAHRGWCSRSMSL